MNTPYGLVGDKIFAPLGAVLSRAAVRHPRGIGERVIGPVNGDHHLRNMYPLEPLEFHLASRRVSQVPRDRFVWLEGDEEAGRLIKDARQAGIFAVSLSALTPRNRRGEKSNALPSIAWTYGDRILVAEIPRVELEQIEPDGEYRFAMRIGGLATGFAGVLWQPRGGDVFNRGETGLVDVVPVGAVPDDIPAH
ncbi:MAG: hypothetical protein WDN27_06505 [Candidatus Saccharibacteria bacterium]